MSNISISAIIPTKNRPTDLEKAVISILNQNYLPSELIVIDQSDDKESYNKVKKIFSTFSIVPNLNYLHDPGIHSLVEAKKKGVSISKGNLISFLEDDIVLCDNYFKNAFKIFNSDENIMGCCGVMTNNHSGYIYEVLFKIFHLGIFHDPRLNIGKKKKLNEKISLKQSRFLSGGISFFERVFLKILNLM